MVDILEQELEDYIFDNYKKLDWLDVDYLERQFNLIGYGIIDLLGIKIEGKFITFRIIELKKDGIDYNALGQLNRYMIGLARNLELIDYFADKASEHHKKEDIFDFNKIYFIKGILIGSKLSSGDICYTLESLNQDIERVEYSVDLKNGINFEDKYDHGWHSTNEEPNDKLEGIVKTAKKISKK